MLVESVEDEFSRNEKNAMVVGGLANKEAEMLDSERAAVYMCLFLFGVGAAQTGRRSADDVCAEGQCRSANCLLLHQCVMHDLDCQQFVSAVFR